MLFYSLYNFDKAHIIAFNINEFGSTIDIVGFENCLLAYSDIINFGTYLGHE